jgi:hypothetical protein
MGIELKRIKKEIIEINSSSSSISENNEKEPSED